MAEANVICEACHDQLDAILDEIHVGLDEIDLDDPDNELLIFERRETALVEAGPIVGSVAQ